MIAEFLVAQRFKLLVALSLFATASLKASESAPVVTQFLEQHCLECHDTETKKGGLDLTALKFNLDDPKSFSEWVKVHDRVREGEMPPKKKPRPAASAMDSFLTALAEPMVAADRTRAAKEGRSTWRRLNRYEYENSLRDLLHAPWLQIKEMLPEDGESHRFNKVGDALDVSHVQMARYLAAADYALREVIAFQPDRPETKTIRYYTRDQGSFTRPMKFSVFNTRPERATFPVLGTEGQPEVRAGKAPISAWSNKEERELEAVGVVASAYEPIEPKFNSFQVSRAGRYKVRLNALSVWVGPGKPDKWWIPDLDKVSHGHRPEPVTLYSEKRPRLLRRLGAFDVGPDPTVNELDVWLLPGETIRPDAARLFRSRPPNWHNPLATKEGQPGVAFRWLEVEGPIYDEWPTAGHRLLFGDLPIKKGKNGKIEIESANANADATSLLRGFLQRAYRRPIEDADVKRFLPVVQAAMKSGSGFADAMIAGYSAVLCSPAFVCLEEKPSQLDDYALAARLSYFLWNSEPDAELRAVAARGELRDRDTLRAQTERMLADAQSGRFVDAFLDYWLDLRKIDATAPDAALYPDYYLDDLLSESATAETQLFFRELLRGDLPTRNIVSSDFAMLNERLAEHYGLEESLITDPLSTDYSKKPVIGVALRRMPLPSGSRRGGLLTQASVLKVTANGTTTSPVVRGAWVMERILGKPPPPPPATVPAIDPDTRGATTIREQLEKHRSMESCAACHAKIDPAGFALENFDVLGGWRDKYRAVGEGKHEQGYGKNGQPFEFHLAQPVDASSTLPDGRKFNDINELKRLLLDDEKQIARNLTRQLVVYSTGAPIRFGDRPEIENILERASSSHFGVKSIIHEIVQSEVFRMK